jgi:hypothetical protein
MHITQIPSIVNPEKAAGCGQMQTAIAVVSGRT